MTDQSPASFPRPDAPLVLLGASGLGEIGEAWEVGQGRMLWSLASGSSLAGREESIILSLDL